MTEGGERKRRERARKLMGVLEVFDLRRESEENDEDGRRLCNEGLRLSLA